MLELNLFPRKSISIQHSNSRKTSISSTPHVVNNIGAITTNALGVVNVLLPPAKQRPPLLRGRTFSQLPRVCEVVEEPRRSSLIFFGKNHSNAIDCRLSIGPLRHLLRQTLSPKRNISGSFLDPNYIPKETKSASFSESLDKMPKEQLDQKMQDENDEIPGKMAKFFGILSWIYEKSRIQKILPLLVLIGYTFAGAYIFSFFEHESEQQLQTNKREYVANQTEHIFSTLQSLRSDFMHVHDFRIPIDYDHLDKWRKKTEYNISHEVYRFALVQYQTVDKELLLSRVPDLESVTVTDIMNKNPILKPYAESKHLPAGDFHKAVLRVELMLTYIKQLQERLAEIIIESTTPDPLNDDPDFDWAQTRVKIEEALGRFTSILGLEHDNHWSFKNALMLAITTYTTIGYGNVVPRTKAGRVAVMIYAIVGIPLMLVILQKMGRAMLKLLQRAYRQFGRLLAITCRCTWLSSSADVSEEEEEEQDVPLTLAVGVTLAWMFLSAELFARAERHWDYFQSFYFVFISFATVGYGDVVPQSEWALWLFTLVFVGLSLLSMTINVIQLKLELLFEAMWQELIQQYTEGTVMDVPPPEDLSVWQMMRMVRKRRQSTHSSLGSQGGSAVTKRRRFGGKRTGKDLMVDWHRLANLRTKSTQTNLADQVHICMQTDFRPTYIRPVDESPIVGVEYDHDRDFGSIDIFSAPHLVGSGGHATPPVSSFLPLPVYVAGEFDQSQSHDANYNARHYAQSQLPTTSNNIHNRNLHRAAGATRASVCSEPDNQFPSSSSKSKAPEPTPRHSIAWSDTNYFRQKLRNPMPPMRETQSTDVYDHKLSNDRPISSDFGDCHNAPANHNHSSNYSSRTQTTASHERGLEEQDDDEEQSDAKKRWVFVKTGLGNRRGPRGLVSNTALSKRHGEMHHPDEMRQLLRQINVRLNDCRQLVQDKPEHLKPSTVKAGQAIFRTAAVVLQPHIQEHKRANV